MSYRDEILKLYCEEGLSTRKIAKIFNMSRSGVFHHTSGHLKRSNLYRKNSNDISVIIPSSKPKSITAIDIAGARAAKLASILHDIITRSNWPVVNPADLLVEARVNSFFDVKSGEMGERAGAPLVYITNILRAAPIEDCRGKRFFFTRAQNSTPVNEQFLDNMEAYARQRGADIVVGPSTYQTNWQAESAEHSRCYDKRIEPYLCFGRLHIGPNFFFAAETNIIATAERPIHNLISFSENKWVVVPHPKQNLVSIPTTDPNKLCSQILSTGSVTVPKVLAKKDGIKSIFHHIFGFVVVEFDMEGRIFCRHVNADCNGSFYDLNYFVKDGHVGTLDEETRPEYIMPADVHCSKLDLADHKDVAATFGFNSSSVVDDSNLISFLKPRRVILQDLHDGNVDSHYIDIGRRVENMAGDINDLEAEVKGDGSFLSRLSLMHPYLEEIIVDESNHDLRLERYIKEFRHIYDPSNALFGSRLQTRYFEHHDEAGRLRRDGAIREQFSLHEWAIREFYPRLDRVSWVYDGESRIINGVEVGNHGFRGTNGSKGSLSGYVKIGCKISYGDKHAAGIMDGAFQAGVMALRQGYNLGPSSWTVSHILQYANSKRCIITMNNGYFGYAERGNPLFPVMKT